MADTTNIPSLQDTLARQHLEAVKTQALQQLLQVFAPGTLQSPVDYRVLLSHVRTLLEQEDASVTATSIVTPPPPEPSQGEPDHV